MWKRSAERKAILPFLFLSTFFSKLNPNFFGIPFRTNDDIFKNDPRTSVSLFSFPRTPVEPSRHAGENEHRIKQKQFGSVFRVNAFRAITVCSNPRCPSVRPYGTTTRKFKNRQVYIIRREWHTDTLHTHTDTRRNTNKQTKTHTERCTVYRLNRRTRLGRK